MTKLQNFASNPKVKKLGAILMCMMICCATLIPMAFAADVSEPTPAEAATQVYESIHAQLNFTTILSVIAVSIGAALGMFLGWWAIRKVAGMVFGAFETGHVSV